MDKILITGTSGYLGSCLRQEFSKTHIIEQLNSRLEEIQPNSLDYDMVIHNAGALRHRKEELYEVNSLGTRKLLQGLKKITKIVYISSKSVYGTKREGILTEQEIPKPDEDYGISKYEGELSIRESGNPYIVIRPSTLFGLAVDNLGPAFPSRAMKLLYNGEDIQLNMPDVSHEYIYVWDVARASLELAGNKNNWNKIFNCSGERRSLFDLIKAESDLVLNKSKKPGRIIIKNEKRSSGYFLDNTLLKNAIGEDYLTPDHIVIERMYNYLKTNS